MLLSEQERNQLEDDLEQQIGKNAFDAIESAILAKLASAELPTNAPHITRRIRACESEVPALVVFEHAWRQAYAQGAASQLSSEPVAHLRKNGFRFLGDFEPQDDSELPLYTRRQA